MAYSWGCILKQILSFPSILFLSLGEFWRICSLVELAQSAWPVGHVFLSFHCPSLIVIFLGRNFARYRHLIVVVTQSQNMVNVFLAIYCIKIKLQCSLDGEDKNKHIVPWNLSEANVFLNDRLQKFSKIVHPGSGIVGASKSSPCFLLEMEEQ